MNSSTIGEPGQAAFRAGRRWAQELDEASAIRAAVQDLVRPEAADPAVVDKASVAALAIREADKAMVPNLAEGADPDLGVQKDGRKGGRKVVPKVARATAATAVVRKVDLRVAVIAASATTATADAAGMIVEMNVAVAMTTLLFRTGCHLTPPALAGGVRGALREKCASGSPA